MHMFLLAGEPSGEQHAARLVKALREIWPDVRLSGTGGPAMKAAGVDLILELEQMNFMGFVEVMKHVGRIRENFRRVKQHLKAKRPDAVILVDYPGFNLRMARWCHRQGFRVIYYIAPQVWAWKESRVRILRKFCDLVLCILPFEEEYFRTHGVKAFFVGHPLADTAFEVPSESARTGLALFPGSRPFEVRNLLPVMLEAAVHLGEKDVTLAVPDGFDRGLYAPFLDTSSLKVHFCSSDEALAQARYAFVKSGTSTLQAALHNVPFLVVYKGHLLSYWIALRLVKVPFVSLVNLLAGREVVREFLQHQVTVENLVDEGRKIRDDASYRQRQVENFAQIRKLLAGGLHAQRAAQRIADFLSVQPTAK